MRVEDLEFRNAARLNNHFFKIKITRQILTLWGGSQPNPQSQSVSTGSDSQKSTFLQTELLRHFTDIHLQFPSKLSLPRSGLLVVKLDLVLITLRLPSPDEFTAEANKPESSPVQAKLKPT